MPDSEKVVDNIISIIDSGGYPPDEVRRPTIQFVVRNKEYSNAVEVAERIFHKYHDKDWYKVGIYEVLNSKAMSEPECIGLDGKHRTEVSLNILFVRGDYSA